MSIDPGLALAIAGLAVGSFLNVCIVRLPARLSIWRPGSACPACGTPIRWHDNIPLVSFMILGGRCRACRAAISWQYPIVEAVTSALFVLTYLRFGLEPALAPALMLVSALIVIVAIDLTHQIIPDVLTLPGIPAGFLANLATGRVGWIDSLVGILAGGGTLFVIIVASRGGMGGGDMKLGAMLGAFLGWRIAFIALLIAVLAGGAVAAVLLMSKIRRRKDPVPFGPFLALGGLVGLLWGERLLTWYLSGFQQ
jgi:leader peptidase (prepilin peptidase)/N-methyltransferase